VKISGYVVLLLCSISIMVSARSVAAQSQLLTDNGRNNPKFTQYKKYQFPKTGGEYRISAISSESKKIETPIPFDSGAFTNGDTTYAYKRRPMPYAYWKGANEVEVTFDFKGNYVVTAIKVHLKNEKTHGTQSARFLGSSDGKAFQVIGDVVKVVDGWNEVNTNGNPLRFLKIVLTKAKGVNFITCSEVEVWGTPGTKAAKKGDATIVIDPQAPKVVAFAATELQNYLAKITGQHFPVVKANSNPQGRLILVGRSSLTDKLGLKQTFEPEAFIIKRVGNNLALIGDDEDVGAGTMIPFDYRTARKGSLYAVYTFLEQFHGVRWFWPGESGEVVPKRERFFLPDVDIEDQPKFAWRHFWFPGGKTAKVVTQYEVPLWYMRNKFGIAFGSPYSFAHSWTRYLDGNKNFEKHPDWYALVDGKRKPFPTYPNGKPKYSGSQVCTSNPEVVNQFVQKLKKHDPKKWMLVSISPNDGGGFCECKNCKALDHPELYSKDQGYNGTVLSDRIFGFANAVAREIRKTHPKMNLGIFSYTYFRPEPQTIAKLENNIVVSMTQICSGYNDPAIEAKARKRIGDWAKKGTQLIGRDYLGLYDWMNVTHPQTQILAKDLKHLRKKNYVGYYWEGALDFASNHLNMWVAGRLLWNTDQDIEAILKDYYSHCYGSAAPKMREYYEMMEQAFMGRDKEFSAYGAGVLPHMYSAEMLARGTKLIDDAKAATDDAGVKKRIEYARLGHELTVDTVTYLRLCQQLSDAGLIVRMRRYKKLDLPQQPSRTELIKLITEAKQRGDALVKRMDSLRNTAAFSGGSFEICDRVFRWRTTVNDYYDLFGAKSVGAIQSLPVKWKFALDPKNAGDKLGWSKSDFNDTKWAEISIDAFWEKQGYKDYDGYAWYRLNDLVLPIARKGKRCVLRFGAVDESCWVYVNGKFAGSNLYDPKKDPDGWKKPRSFDITKFLRWDGPNSITVKVFDSGYAGGIWQGAMLVFEAAARQVVFSENFESADWNKAGRTILSGKDYTAEIEEADDNKALGIKVNKPMPSLATAKWLKIPLEAGSSYALSLKYRIDHAEENAAEKARWRKRPSIPSARIIFTDAKGKTCVSVKQYVWANPAFAKSTDGWRDLRKIFVAPEKTAFASITLFFNAKGEYAVDDVRIEEW
jgi:Domain of unknown function (DUF4838)/Glycosyl hydrolases family 2, sugar binding domain